MSDDWDGREDEGTTRVDKWLWAVRLYKTRTAATEACKAGHVKVNGTSAKPATAVGPGDTVRALVENRERVVEVAHPISKRVGAALAASCFVDHSPAMPPSEATAVVFTRPKGTGRPSKRDRRQLDRLRRS
ncbi:MAG: RNA-binding S4 domain-containing protein [Acidimicrobiales bacterium]